MDLSNLVAGEPTVTPLGAATAGAVSFALKPQGSGRLLQECLDTGIFPGDALVFRSQNAARGSREPRFLAESHVVHGHGYKYR